jgi:acyl-CoA synthetase (AMP-forming)/AMP-acid ligase II
MAMMMSGVSLAIGKGFSVRNFWKDVRDSEATVIVYVGETARYLLAATPSPMDRQHKVRCMYGNGLRPDVWLKFRERFGVEEIIEFFNSSEGLFSLFNWNRGDYTASCVGHHGALLRLSMNDQFIPVEVDNETNELVRDPKTGFAKRKSYEQGGEIIVQIPQEAAFAGYWKNPTATKKKFAYDVFKKGDIFYRSGDALRRTSDGRWYFLDRLGDTYRWKSENVSTAEVAHTIGQFPGVLEMSTASWSPTMMAAQVAQPSLLLLRNVGRSIGEASRNTRANIFHDTLSLFSFAWSRATLEAELCITTNKTRRA